MRDRLYSTEAVVLKRSDFGEADRLLTLYTPFLGKRRVIAKGVRKPASRKAGHLELFTHSRLLLARGRSLDIITQAESVQAFPELRKDLVKTSRAYYVAELLDRFSEEGIENRPLFELLVSSLTWLNAGENVELGLRYYELHLMDHVGYRPQLFQCVTCRAELRPVINYFSPVDGGVLCPRCGEPNPLASPIEVNTLKVLRYLQRNPFDACRQLQLNATLRRELEHVMLRYITCYLERNLKSVEFIRLLRQQDEVVSRCDKPSIAPPEEETHLS